MLSRLILAFLLLPVFSFASTAELLSNIKKSKNLTKKIETLKQYKKSTKSALMKIQNSKGQGTDQMHQEMEKLTMLEGATERILELSNQTKNCEEMAQRFHASFNIQMAPLHDPDLENLKQVAGSTCSK